MNAEQALTLLKEGNERFASGQCIHPNQDAKRLKELIEGQNPYVTVLSCSDSRIPPELLFDAGFGDLFVVRVAGNVFGDIAFGAIEFGVEHLKTPLYLVLGHTHCGAIKAAIKDDDASSYVADLVDKVKRAVNAVQKKHPDMPHDQLVETSVRYNVYRSIEDTIRKSALVRKRVKDGSLTVVGAIYQLEDGCIEWLGEHPQQDDILCDS